MTNASRSFPTHSLMMFTGSYFKHPDQLRTLHSALAALCTMAALEKLSPLAQMYESEFQRAFKLYGDGKDDVKADEAFASVAGFSSSLISGAGSRGISSAAWILGRL
jgi:hypothetical protein